MVRAISDDKFMKAINALLGQMVRLCHRPLISQDLGEESPIAELYKANRNLCE